MGCSYSAEGLLGRLERHGTRLGIGVRVLAVEPVPGYSGLVSGWDTVHGLRGKRSEGLGGRWEQRECARVVLSCWSEGRAVWDRCSPAGLLEARNGRSRCHSMGYRAWASTGATITFKASPRGLFPREWLALGTKRHCGGINNNKGCVGEVKPWTGAFTTTFSY